MKIKSLNILLFSIILSSANFAQFSFYSSASYGYYHNPLYNYEELPDQLKQTYTELSYNKKFETSRLAFNYISGLVLFNRFEERNYYEHNLSSNYKINLSKQSGDNSDEESDVDKKDEFTDQLLNFILTVGGRHDKEIFKEFNNLGASLLASHRFALNNDHYLLLSNLAGYRDYTNIPELSNIIDILSLQLANNPVRSFNYGLTLSGGLKYYTESIYDTSKYEATRSFTTTYTGKGKTGAKITVPSDKVILIDQQANGTVQYVGDLYLKYNWDKSSFQTNFLYRFNPNTLVRYLAQYTTTSFLTEDIYNDVFSYEGYEISSRLTQKIFYDIDVRLDFSFDHKMYGAPALSLIGTEVADQRLDLRTTIESYISKYFNLSDNLGMGVAISSGFVRNQSNDAYNDFSAYYISLSIGFGIYAEF